MDGQATDPPAPSSSPNRPHPFTTRIRFQSSVLRNPTPFPEHWVCFPCRIIGPFSRNPFSERWLATILSDPHWVCLAWSGPPPPASVPCHRNDGRRPRIDRRPRPACGLLKVRSPTGPLPATACRLRFAICRCPFPIVIRPYSFFSYHIVAMCRRQVKTPGRSCLAALPAASRQQTGNPFKYREL